MYLLFLLGCLCQLTDSSPQEEDSGIYWLSFNEKPCSEVCSAANKKHVAIAGHSVCSARKENEDLYQVGVNDEIDHKKGCGVVDETPATQSYFLSYPSTRKCLCTGASLTTNWQHNFDFHGFNNVTLRDCEDSCSNEGKRALRVNGRQDYICSHYFLSYVNYRPGLQLITKTGSKPKKCHIADQYWRYYDCLCIKGLKAISDTTKAPELTTVAKTVPQVTETKSTGTSVRQRSTTPAPLSTTVKIEVNDGFEIMHGRQLYGRTIKTRYFISISDCMKACKQEVACVGFSFDDVFKYRFSRSEGCTLLGSIEGTNNCTNSYEHCTSGRTSAKIVRFDYPKYPNSDILVDHCFTLDFVCITKFKRNKRDYSTEKVCRTFCQLKGFKHCHSWGRLIIMKENLTRTIGGGELCSIDHSLIYPCRGLEWIKCEK